MANQWQRFARGAGAWLAASSMSACVMDAGRHGETQDGDVELTAVSSALDLADDTSAALTYMPTYHLRGDTKCFPLTLHEVGPSSPDSALDALKSYCRSTYGAEFAVFARVERRSPDTMRIAYFVAFGKQDFPDVAGIVAVGDHAEDVETIVVDIVDGVHTSTRYNVHRGAFTRTSRMITRTGESSHAWVGRYGHAMYHSTDRYVPPLLNEGPATRVQANFGDNVGSDHVTRGKLVMIDDVCAAGYRYVSPSGGVEWTGTRSAALKAVVGCSGAAGVWGNDLKGKGQYHPYGLAACETGTTFGGNVCNASAFGTGSWATQSGIRSIMPGTVGEADVDETRGGFFNDIGIDSVPTAITIRGGERLDGVSVTYQDGTVRRHGGTGGSSATLSGLVGDPIVSLRLCPASKDGRWRAGSMSVTTSQGRTIARGQSEADGTHPCRTFWTGDRFTGFYGRAGAEIDLLGPIVR